MDYRLVIYNDRIYKEVTLSENLNTISIGTLEDADVQVYDNCFDEDFLITIKKMLTNIYLSAAVV